MRYIVIYALIFIEFELLLVVYSTICKIHKIRDILQFQSAVEVVAYRAMD